MPSRKDSPIHKELTGFPQPASSPEIPTVISTCVSGVVYEAGDGFESGAFQFGAWAKTTYRW